MRRYRIFLIILMTLLGVLALLPGLVVRAEFGTNWTAVFYNNPDWAGSPVATITGVNGVNFLWSGAPQINGQNPVGNQQETFSVKFSSNQNFLAGNYDFIVAFDDGVRVTIDGQLKVQELDGGLGQRTVQFTQAMTAGSHNILVEHYDGVGVAVIQFQWFQQGATGTTLPNVTPTPVFTAVPPLTGQVIGVKGLALRTGPYLGASLVAVVRPGVSYPIYARNQDEGGGFTWYRINVDGRDGWSSGRYLQLTGDPNSVPLQGTIFDQIDGAPTVGAFASPRSVMNLRRRPSQRATLLDQIPWGANLDLVGRTIQSGNNFWLQVRYEDKVGWIYAPFVSVSGDLNAVPVR